MRTARLLLQRTLTSALLAVVVLAAAAAAADARTLRAGDRGPDVRALNRQLIAQGYLPGPTPSERFGAATQHAVFAAQKWHGLGRDGIAGPVTKAALAKDRRPVPQTTGAGRRIEVLIRRQVALLIDAGRVVRTISVSTGADGYRTPPGRFRVFRKERQSWSVPYRVWLPYASYFTGGVAFHEWASVPPYPASHGCVRVPRPFAAEVYAFAAMGTRVDVLHPAGELGGDESPAGPYGP